MGIGIPLAATVTPDGVVWQPVVATIVNMRVPGGFVKFACTVAFPLVNVAIGVLELTSDMEAVPLVTDQFTNTKPASGDAEMEVAAPDSTVCAPVGVAVP